MDLTKIVDAAKDALQDAKAAVTSVASDATAHAKDMVADAHEVVTGAITDAQEKMPSLEEVKDTVTTATDKVIEKAEAVTGADINGDGTTGATTA
ncbi:MAG: hypothetical protein WAX38_02565 [Minisyncoccia bacterium]